jgi:predicted methyltransferase
MMRLLVSVAAAGVVALGSGDAFAQGSAYSIPAGTPDNIRRAVESAARTEEQRARDSGRRPAEILTLAGIEYGDEVIEFASFGHYYTTILVEAVGPDGHVHMIDLPWTEPFGGRAARAFDAEHANATYTLAHYNRADFPNGVDVVTMVLFYHDLKTQAGEQSVDTADMNARIFDALRPGGTYLVVDHKALDFAGWRDDSALHRIDEATIIREVMAAGFELAASSNILANPEDDHTIAIRDPSIRGRTDRAVLVFRKPGR